MSETTKVSVKKITIEGVKYFIDADNDLYDPETNEHIGNYNRETKVITPVEDDDDEEDDEEDDEDDSDEEERRYVDELVKQGKVVRQDVDFGKILKDLATKPVEKLPYPEGLRLTEEEERFYDDNKKDVDYYTEYELDKYYYKTDHQYSSILWNSSKKDKMMRELSDKMAQRKWWDLGKSEFRPKTRMDTIEYRISAIREDIIKEKDKDAKKMLLKAVSTLIKKIPEAEDLDNLDRERTSMVQEEQSKRKYDKDFIANEKRLKEEAEEKERRRLRDIEDAKMLLTPAEVKAKIDSGYEGWVEVRKRPFLTFKKLDKDPYGGKLEDIKDLKYFLPDRVYKSWGNDREIFDPDTLEPLGRFKEEMFGWKIIFTELGKQRLEQYKAEADAKKAAFDAPYASLLAKLPEMGKYAREYEYSTLRQLPRLTAGLIRAIDKGVLVGDTDFLNELITLTERLPVKKESLTTEVRLEVEDAYIRLIPKIEELKKIIKSLRYGDTKIFTGDINTYMKGDLYRALSDADIYASEYVRDKERITNFRKQEIEEMKKEKAKADKIAAKKASSKEVIANEVKDKTANDLAKEYNALLEEYKTAKARVKDAEDSGIIGRDLKEKTDKAKELKDKAIALRALYDAKKEEEKGGKGIDSCWKGYEAIGMKKKGKRLVPNCVPITGGQVVSLGQAADNISEYDEVYKFSNPKVVQEKAKKYLGEGGIIYRSISKGKKYMVYNPNTEKWVHFGQIPYEDFTKHKDEKRRKSYLKRTANMKGDWKDDKYSANNLSRNLLW
jgi:hypothetical protein